MNRLLLAPLFLVACTASASQRAASEEPSRADPAPRVPASEQQRPTNREVIGVMQSHAGLILQIHSGGCRTNSQVDFTVVDTGLTIASLADEDCRAEIPLGVTLLFPWAELPMFSKLAIAPDEAPVLEPSKHAGATKRPAGTFDEPLYGVLVEQDGIDVRVWSGGCTSAADFTAWIEPGETELVHLVRTRFDGCEAEIPEGTLVHLSWEQLGVTKDSARVVNPIKPMPRS